jgi:hypothetical protein
METELNSPWLDRDELEVIRTFLDAGVRFVIVGGRAVRQHRAIAILRGGAWC